jgi:RHS repeat-associated protein
MASVGCCGQRSSIADSHSFLRRFCDLSTSSQRPRDQRVEYDLRFPRQYSLNETGLFYNYFRNYDPQTGRYLESDPIGLMAGSVSTYSYDATGNTHTYSNLTFLYTQRGRLSTVTVGSTTSNYVYSALGQMIKKTVGSATTLLVYDEAGHLSGEYSSSGALIQETVWMGDIPVATLRPNGSTGCTSTICIFYVHGSVERAAQDHAAERQQTRLALGPESIRGRHAQSESRISRNIRLQLAAPGSVLSSRGRAELQLCKGL